jgi:OFA family oxalate/formate antiporter-like MFS transporter
LAIYGLTFTVVFVPFVHLVPFAQGFGASLRTASTVLSSIGVGGLLGRLIVGPISDRIDRRKAVVLTLMLETAAFVGIALSSNLWLLYPSALAFGFAYGGGVTVFPALVGDYFGRANVGAIVGRVFASAGALSAVGPYGAQLMYDQFGSYRLAFLLSAAANGMAMVLATRLPQPHH